MIITALQFVVFLGSLHALANFQEQVKSNLGLDGDLVLEPKSSVIEYENNQKPKPLMESYPLVADGCERCHKQVYSEIDAQFNNQQYKDEKIELIARMPQLLDDEIYSGTDDKVITTNELPIDYDYHIFIQEKKKKNVSETESENEGFCPID